MVRYLDANTPTPTQAKMQSLYATHRSTRNAQQRERFLSSGFKGLSIDPILLRLENPELEPGFQDARHCLVFWARPPEHILKLASHLQTLLRKAAPSKGPLPVVEGQSLTSWFGRHLAHAPASNAHDNS